MVPGEIILSFRAVHIGFIGCFGFGFEIEYRVGSTHGKVCRATATECLFSLFGIAILGRSILPAGHGCNGMDPTGLLIPGRCIGGCPTGIDQLSTPCGKAIRVCNKASKGARRM